MLETENPNVIETYPFVCLICLKTDNPNKGCILYICTPHLPECNRRHWTIPCFPYIALIRIHHSNIGNVLNIFRNCITQNGWTNRQKLTTSSSHCSAFSPILTPPIDMPAKLVWGAAKKKENILYMLVGLYQIHSLLCPVLALLLRIHVMHLSVQHFGNTTAVYLHWRWIGIWMWSEIGNGYIGNGSMFIQTRNNVKNAGNLERVHISRFSFHRRRKVL